MITRIVIVTFVAVLALPIATLPRPLETSPLPWSDVAVEAKVKKHKHHKRPKTKTVRQEVTRTFSSTEPILIPDGAPSTTFGPAYPYPSAIAVSGFRHGTITDVDLLLTDLTHTHHPDLDVVLSSSDGRRALVMSDVAGSSDVADIELMLDDEATASMPGSGSLRSGTFRPTNIDDEYDTFAAPAPTPNGDIALNAFDGADPNGTWQLWVMDNGSGDIGDLGGWALEITAEVDVKVNKKHKKRN